MARPSSTDTDSAKAESLVRDNLAHARFIASHMARKLPAMADDFESAALEALWLAARRFDPSRGVKFRAFATRRITGAIQDVSRAAIPSGYSRDTFGLAPETESLDVLLVRDSRNEFQYFIATIPDHRSDGTQRRDTLESLRSAIRGLDANERAVVLGYYADGLSMREVSKAVGLCESHVWRMHDRILLRLRDDPRVLARLSGEAVAEVEPLREIEVRELFYTEASRPCHDHPGARRSSPSAPAARSRPPTSTAKAS